MLYTRLSEAFPFTVTPPMPSVTGFDTLTSSRNWRMDDANFRRPLPLMSSVISHCRHFSSVMSNVPISVSVPVLLSMKLTVMVLSSPLHGPARQLSTAPFSATNSGEVSEPGVLFVPKRAHCAPAYCFTPVHPSRSVSRAEPPMPVHMPSLPPWLELSSKVSSSR
ncbi:unknown [Prevotella sp. CAG:487]|nr:unknown [Prevotella sp. CAG:487]